MTHPNNKTVVHISHHWASFDNALVALASYIPFFPNPKKSRIHLNNPSLHASHYTTVLLVADFSFDPRELAHDGECSNEGKDEVSE